MGEFEHFGPESLELDCLHVKDHVIFELYDETPDNVINRGIDSFYLHTFWYIRDGL